jgi:hypothetical protein
MAALESVAANTFMQVRIVLHSYTKNLLLEVNRLAVFSCAGLYVLSKHRDYTQCEYYLAIAFQIYGYTSNSMPCGRCEVMHSGMRC